jgi:hypothetical protein
MRRNRKIQHHIISLADKGYDCLFHSPSLAYHRGKRYMARRK